MHLHQHRVGFKKLAQGWKIAQTKNVQPDRFETFEELYDWVELEVANQVSGLGKLVTYDVALRLGMWLKLEPAVVYLHGGTSKGAEKLNVKGETAPLSAFPPEIQKLGATHAENFLCIYKNRLNRF